MKDTTTRMMARVRDQLDRWDFDERETIEWLMRDNKLLGAAPHQLIEWLDYSVEAYLLLAVPMSRRIDA